MSSPPTSRSFSSKEIEKRYLESLEFLFGRINYERSPNLASGLQSFSLQKMQSLLDRLGNPQNELPCVHIAGSKGKGSTATMVARILETAGYRVGLFTSPHAHRYEERFTINEKLASKAEVVSIVDQLRVVTAKMDNEPDGGPTFFELSTAAGWLHFVKNQCQIAVIEVGLGGRLDSTNVCNPLVSIIASISKDHTRLLGSTEDLIAREKAGIIKTDIPVVSGVLNSEPACVIQEVANDVGAPLYQLGQEFQVTSIAPCENAQQVLPAWSLNFSLGEFSLSDVQLAMPGEHQTQNASLAIIAVRLLSGHGFEVSEEHLRNGLRSARLPLRIEVFNQEPIVVIDAAHNPASIEALCQTLQPIKTKRRLCIFASSRDKDCAELLRILDKHFDEFLLTAYQENPRAISTEELAEMASVILTHPFSLSASPEEAIKKALSDVSPSDFICATGSFFLAAEMEQFWRASHDEAYGTKLTQELSRKKSSN